MIYGNVSKHGVITSLPEGSAVEVLWLADYNGVRLMRTCFAASGDGTDLRRSERAGICRRRATGRQPRTYLPRRDAGLTHRGRLGIASDLGLSRRSSEIAPHMAAGMCTRWRPSQVCFAPSAFSFSRYFSRGNSRHNDWRHGRSTIPSRLAGSPMTRPTCLPAKAAPNTT